MSHLSERFLGSLVTTSTTGWHMVACETSIWVTSFIPCKFVRFVLFCFFPLAPSLFDLARQWMNQSGEPCFQWLTHGRRPNSSSNRTTRKWEFGSRFCRLATRRLNGQNRVEFHNDVVEFGKDAMPLDLLISIQDGAGYAFNSIDVSYSKH